MKRSVLLFCCFLVALLGAAQDTLVHRYKTGELSSREILVGRNKTDRDRFGTEKVQVFSRAGVLVYEGHRRNYAGHASVYLTYHKNGGVSKIETSDAPDAGIQWHHSQYKLDEEGKVIEFTEQSNDDLKEITFIQPIEKEQPQKTVVKTPAPNECAVLTETKIVLCNKRKKAITCLLVPIVKHPDHKLTNGKLGFDDTIGTTGYHHAEKFSEPKELYDLYVKTKSGEEMRKIEWSELPVKILQPDAQHRVYYFYWVD